MQIKSKKYININDSKSKKGLPLNGIGNTGQKKKDRERLEFDKKLKEQLNRNKFDGSISMINHGDVLKALSQTLKKTKESYLDIAHKMKINLNEKTRL